MNITYTPTNDATLTILRDPTMHYAIGAKADLNDPWSGITHIWSYHSTSPIYTFTHPEATNYPRRFYGIQPLIEPCHSPLCIRPRHSCLGAARPRDG